VVSGRYGSGSALVAVREGSGNAIADYGYGSKAASVCAMPRATNEKG
jgi:hypothetical protein